ncbi:hypothetical protein P154DRAFT_580847 [Amniculicola lignicola CBS 123094]|uniref:Rhodanese domain-containing protein n=1 Tax=Amniculicola lignicola CBS 123094 TaxID=1392246 RepID=A0A6A5W2X9_9PLEO|nr:hypothetical protein P154DRAFT_580847 [Amniculicola lignicola CBS 123094]
MSDITISDLEQISREELAERFKKSPNGGLPKNIAIIDVRDSDHIGGHIRGSTWVPSSDLDFRTPELIRTLKDKDTVVFHCMLSQQRGPSAALRYLREKGRLDHLGITTSKGVGEEGNEAVEKGQLENKEGEPAEQAEGAEGAEGKRKRQKVVVLDGGFGKWQEKYGEDGNLTEAYQKDIWEFGY